MSRLDPAELRAALGHCVIGREVFVLNEATSTNDSVLQMTTPATAEGLVVFAEHQTAGRGQRGNRWESAPQKGLWFSILLRPKIDIDKSARLTTWAAETVANTVREHFSLRATVKFPNDVQIDGRKMAGVLVEMRAQQGGPHLAIAGIGINVNHVAEDFPEELRAHATSLAIELDRSAKGRIRRGEQVDRVAFAIALLRNLDQTYQTSFGR
jgi:BirA family biotin operon repressor/biotin-[acetyl-CoA-carboxylase] ligase